MARKSSFERFLLGLEMPYKAKKKTRANQLRQVILEAVEELDFGSHRGSPKLYGVTFDRVKSQDFDYWLFDEMLVQIDAGEGGNGIMKPLNQLRTLRWRNSPDALRDLILRIVSFYPQMQFDALFIFEIGKGGNAGYKLKRTVYRK